MSVEIYSLHFDLACQPPGSMSLIVQLPGNRFSRPLDPGKSWLDVEAGNIIIFNGKRHIIRSVSPYRTSLCGSGYPVVKSGRAWLREIGSGTINM
jgi:hypothetical protein